MPNDVCMNCKGEITVMAFKGTIVCSTKCRKELIESQEKLDRAGRS